MLTPTPTCHCLNRSHHSRRDQHAVGLDRVAQLDASGPQRLDGLEGSPVERHRHHQWLAGVPDHGQRAAASSPEANSFANSGAIVSLLPSRS